MSFLTRWQARRAVQEANRIIRASKRGLRDNGTSTSRDGVVSHRVYDPYQEKHRWRLLGKLLRGGDRYI